MENYIEKKQEKRHKRALRVRKHLKGTAMRPRLCVIKTNSHLYAQLIDDEKGCTLASLSTLSKELRGTEFSKKGKEAASEIGKRLAAVAQEKGVSTITFDRGCRKYHGILAALAEAARDSGLSF